MRAIILCGGFGTRLRSISGSTPKCMMPVMGRPMVDLIIKNLRKQDIDDITLALHYKSEAFVDYFRGTVKYKIESEPLGTGGAIKNCIINDEPVLVMNGDTILHIDYWDMLVHHNAPITVAVKPGNISSGVCILNPEVIGNYHGKFSLEHDVIPNTPHGFYSISWFSDLGTPEAYAKCVKDWV